MSNENSDRYIPTEQNDGSKMREHMRSQNAKIESLESELLQLKAERDKLKEDNYFIELTNDASIIEIKGLKQEIESLKEELKRKGSL